MPKKQPAHAPSEPEQLVFPVELRLGDVIVYEGIRSEVVSPAKAGPAGKTTGAWIRREGETVQLKVIGDAGRKVRVVKRVASMKLGLRPCRLRTAAAVRYGRSAHGES